MREGHPSLGALVGPAALPAQLARIFGKPPILKTESIEDFNLMFNRFAATLRPRDDIESFSVWFYAIKSWELLRYYRIRTGIVDMGRNEAVYFILERIGNRPGSKSIEPKLVALAEGLFQRPGKARDDLIAFLSTYDIDEDAITAEAVSLRLRELESVDRMIGSVEAGRNVIVREMIFYRQEFATRFREAERDLCAHIEQQAPLAPLIESAGNSETSRTTSDENDAQAGGQAEGHGVPGKG
jgi:hypothetical protein